MNDVVLKIGTQRINYLAMSHEIKCPQNLFQQIRRCKSLKQNQENIVVAQNDKVLLFTELQEGKVFVSSQFEKIPKNLFLLNENSHKQCVEECYRYTKSLRSAFKLLDPRLIRDSSASSFEDTIVDLDCKIYYTFDRCVFVVTEFDYKMSYERILSFFQSAAERNMMEFQFSEARLGKLFQYSWSKEIH